MAIFLFTVGKKGFLSGNGKIDTSSIIMQLKQCQWLQDVTKEGHESQK